MKRYKFLLLALSLGLIIIFFTSCTTDNPVSEEISERRFSYFEVFIDQDKSNTAVVKGQDIEIAVYIENKGTLGGVQDIEAVVDGDVRDIREELSLEGGKSKDITLTFTAEAEDDGEEVTIRSKDESVTAILSVDTDEVVEEYTVTLEQEPDVGATLKGDGDYEGGDTVELEATDWDEDEYEFVNWTSDEVTIDYAESAEDASFEMPAEDVTVTANFEELEYTVTFAEESELEGVEITVEGEDPITTDEDGEATIDLVDGEYDFTATKDGYEDYEGSFTVDGEDKTVDFEMEEEPEEYTVVLTTLTGEGNVIATWNGEEESLSETGDDFTLEPGTEVTFESDAADGYEFAEWLDDASEETEDTFTISIEEDYDIGVEFTDES